jgi:hypothetical protein
MWYSYEKYGGWGLFFDHVLMEVDLWVRIRLLGWPLARYTLD